MSSSDGFWILVAFSVIVGIIWGILKGQKTEPKIGTSKPNVSDSEESELSREDSEGDGLMSEGDLFFPSEEDD